MYATIFDYIIDHDNNDFIMVKASCKDIDKAPIDLRVELPKGFIPSASMRKSIEQMSEFHLRIEKRIKLNKQEREETNEK